MKKKTVLKTLAVTLILSVFSVGCFTTLWAMEQGYSENEMNYVEGSMDISGGIPEDAVGVLLRIRQNGVLRVATEPYFVPQEFIDPTKQGQDKYQGADMELARLIAQKMGVELEIVEMDFTEVLSAVAEDRCDLAISALAFTPGRAVTNEMSKGYYYSDVPHCSVLIRQEDEEDITSIKSLEDRILIAQQGSVQETMMVSNVTRYQEFRRVLTAQMVYDAVAGGEADAGAVDKETAQDYIERNPGCGLTFVKDIEFELESQYQGDRIAAKKGELQLMYFVNGVIDEVLENDMYSEWIKEARTRADELGL